MPDEVSTDDRLAVIQAAIAATLAAALDAPLIRDGGDAEIADQVFFVLAGGLGGIGQPLLEELLPLELLMKEAESGDGDASGDDARPITDTALLLDSLTARLQDTILNPALPYQLVAPLIGDLKPINEIFGEALESAEVAGQIGLSDAAQRADEFLFKEGRPTPVLERYQHFETDVEAASKALRELGANTSADERALLQTKLDRLEAEWIGIGMKREVERAFAMVTKAQSDAGFEDERQALLDRFRSGERLRADAPGLSYHQSQLVPTSPLFTERQQDKSWKRVGLDRAGVIDVIDARARAAFNLSLDDIERGTDEMVELSFEYLVCDIVRDWLDPAFFEARYWREQAGTPPLSDGRGGGRLPVIPKRIAFIRDVAYSTQGISIEAAPSSAGPMMMLQVKAVPKRVAVAAHPTRADESLLKAAKKAGLTSAARVIRTENAAAAALARPAARLNVTGLTQKARLSASVSQPRRKPKRPAGAGSPRTSVFTRAITGAKESIVSSARNVATRAGGAVIRRRDHRRKRPTAGGATSRTRARRPKRPTRRDVRVIGSITAGAEDAALLDAVRISFVAGTPATGGEQAVNTTRASDTRRSFDLTLSATLPVSGEPGKRQLVKNYALLVRQSNGEVIARQLVDMTKQQAQVKVEWRVATQPDMFAIAEESPVVHGYVVRGVPKCPNPDDALVWE